MFDRRGKQPATKPNPNNVTPMPNASNVPPPPAPQHSPQRGAPVEQAYAEEALRAAQRAIDQVREIEYLKRECDAWEREALLAKSEISRLEKRVLDLSAELERRTLELGDERDLYRFRLNNFVAQFQAAGAIILKCLDTAKSEQQPRVDFHQLAEEIDRQMQAPQHVPLPPTEPVPRAVTAGPRLPDEDDKPVPPPPPQAS